MVVVEMVEVVEVYLNSLLWRLVSERVVVGPDGVWTWLKSPGDCQTWILSTITTPHSRRLLAARHLQSTNQRAPSQEMGGNCNL